MSGDGAGAGDAESLRAEVAKLNALIDTPEISDFLLAVQIEAAHQRKKWGDGHDEAKGRGDWTMLRCKLMGKLVDAHWKDNREKYLHHLVTLAAVCFNEHRIIAPNPYPEPPQPEARSAPAAGEVSAMRAWRDTFAKEAPEDVYDAIEKALKPYADQIPPRCDSHGRDHIVNVDGEDMCQACHDEGFSGECGVVHADTIAIDVAKAFWPLVVKKIDDALDERDAWGNEVTRLRIALARTQREGEEALAKAKGKPAAGDGKYEAICRIERVFHDLGDERLRSINLHVLAGMCYEAEHQAQPAPGEQRAEVACKTLAKRQPCGCVVCTCKDPKQCHGCGAKHCGTHAVGAIPNPIYEPDAAGKAGGEGEMVEMVAKAIYSETVMGQEGQTWDDIDESWHELHYAQARVAIAAMRGKGGVG